MPRPHHPVACFGLGMLPPPPFCACLLDLFAHPSQQLCKLLDVLLMHPVSLKIRTVGCGLSWNLMLVPQASNSKRVAKAFSAMRGTGLATDQLVWDLGLSV